MIVLYAWHRYPLLPDERHLHLVREGFRPSRPHLPPRTTYLVSLTVDEVLHDLVPHVQHPIEGMAEFIVTCTRDKQWVSRGRMKMWVAHDLSRAEPVAKPWMSPMKRWPHLRPVDIEIDSLDEIASIIAA